jgi:hypothetical protein
MGSSFGCWCSLLLGGVTATRRAWASPSGLLVSVRVLLLPLGAHRALLLLLVFALLLGGVTATRRAWVPPLGLLVSVRVVLLPLGAHAALLSGR